MWTLAKFIFKRDRLSNLCWILVLGLLTIGVAAAFGEMFGSQEELMGMVVTLDNPAMIAMLGPLYEYSTAGVFTQTMLAFMALFVGIWNIFLVTKHTRADEEEGRLEVLRSLPIGRMTNLLATSINVFVVNVILGLLVGFGLAAVGMEVGYVGSGVSSFEGAIVFGAIFTATGLVFAAATALFVQFSANTRTVITCSFVFLGGMYLLRAVGDLNVEALSLISPLGISLRAQAFVGNYWWPIFIMFAITGIFFGFALYLNQKRDLGAGLFAEKPGPAKASWILSNNFLLTLKLCKGLLIGWLVTGFVLGASYGTVLGDVESFISSNEMFEMIFAHVPDHELITAFISFVVTMMALISVAAVVMVILKLKAEERKNRVEHIVSRHVSRFNMIGSYTLIAFILAPLMLFMLVLGLYGGGSTVADNLNFASMTRTVMVYTPALWLFLGLTVFFVGLLPKLTSLVWVLFGLTFIIGYMGQILEFPDWMNYVTPFGYIPNYPVEPIEILPLVGLIVVALVLTVLGFIGYRKRDITG